MRPPGKSDENYTTYVYNTVKPPYAIHAWKFLVQFRPRKVSPSPQSSSLKFRAAISPARQERKSVRLYRHVRENWH